MSAGYTVVSCGSLANLAIVVNSNLEEGYVVHGPLIVERGIYYQVMLSTNEHARLRNG